MAKDSYFLFDADYKMKEKYILSIFKTKLGQLLT